MSCTVEKIISDARMLVNRLKEHDSSADNVISQATVLHKRVEAMKIVSTVKKLGLVPKAVERNTAPNSHGLFVKKSYACDGQSFSLAYATQFYDIGS